MAAIISSNLQEAQYDEAQELLIVTFKNGTRYAYKPVNGELYASFAATFDGTGPVSAGKFFSANIRSLPCEKLEE